MRIHFFKSGTYTNVAEEKLANLDPDDATFAVRVREEDEVKELVQLVREKVLFMVMERLRPQRLFDVLTWENGPATALAVGRGIYLSDGRIFDTELVCAVTGEQVRTTHHVRGALLSCPVPSQQFKAALQTHTTLVLCDTASISEWTNIAGGTKADVAVVRRLRDPGAPIDARCLIVSHAAMRSGFDLFPFFGPFWRVIICDALADCDYLFAKPELRGTAWTWVLGDLDVYRSPVHATRLLSLLHVFDDAPQLLSQAHRLCLRTRNVSPTLGPLCVNLVMAEEVAGLSPHALKQRCILGAGAHTLSLSNMDGVVQEMRDSARAGLFSTPREECAICYDKIVDCAVPCGHLFCLVCLRKWPSKSCPLCRARYARPLLPLFSAPSKIQWLREWARPGTRSLILVDRDLVHPVKLALEDTEVPRSELCELRSVSRVRAGRMLASSDAFTMVVAFQERATLDLSRVARVCWLHTPTESEGIKWRNLVGRGLIVAAVSENSTEQTRLVAYDSVVGQG
jgi:hypothetical protein